eukprot:jgi/Ulvmu1/11158/UM071_0042.1
MLSAVVDRFMDLDTKGCTPSFSSDAQTSGASTHPRPPRLLTELLPRLRKRHVQGDPHHPSQVINWSAHGMAQSGFAALPAPIIPGTRAVSLEIDAIIRKARPKVDTRHELHRGNAPTGDRGPVQDPGSVAWHHSAARQQLISPESTPVKLMKHKVAAPSRPACTILIHSDAVRGDPAISQTCPDRTVRGSIPYDIRLRDSSMLPCPEKHDLPWHREFPEGIDDSMPSGQSFFHSAAFSPGGSDTCSSWNLSPDPQLLDMTKPSALFQPGYDGNGAGHSTTMARTKAGSTAGTDLSLPRRPTTSRLQNKIPHVSHFSVPQGAAAPRQGARHQACAQPQLDQQRDTQRDITSPARRLQHNEARRVASATQDIVMYRNAYAASKLPQSRSPSTSASSPSRASPNRMHDRGSSSQLPPAAVVAARTRAGAPADEEAVDVSLSTWESPASIGVGRRSRLGTARQTSSATWHSAARTEQRLPRSQSAPFDEDEPVVSGSAGGAAQRNGSRLEPRSMDVVDCMRDNVVSGMHPAVSGQVMSTSDRKETHLEGLASVGATAEFNISSPELLELELELHRERADLKQLGFLGKPLQTQQRSYTTASDRTATGSGMAGRQAGSSGTSRHSAAAGTPPSSRQGSPLGRASRTGQPYAAMYTQARTRGSPKRELGQHQSSPVGGAASLQHSLLSKSSTPEVSPPRATSPLARTRCSKGAGYACLNTMRKQVQQELIAPHETLRPKSCPARTASRSMPSSPSAPLSPSPEDRPAFTVPHILRQGIHHGASVAASVSKASMAGALVATNTHASPRPATGIVTHSPMATIRPPSAGGTHAMRDTSPRPNPHGGGLAAAIPASPNTLRVSHASAPLIASCCSSLSVPSQAGDGLAADLINAHLEPRGAFGGDGVMPGSPLHRPPSRAQPSQYSDASEAGESDDSEVPECSAGHEDASKFSDALMESTMMKPQARPAGRAPVHEDSQEAAPARGSGAPLQSSPKAARATGHAKSDGTPKEAAMTSQLADTPSKVVVLVHAIEELIAQAGHAGHGDIARSLSHSLRRGKSLPATPLRSAKSAPSVTFGSSRGDAVSSQSNRHVHTSPGGARASGHTVNVADVASTCTWLASVPIEQVRAGRNSSNNGTLGAGDLVPAPGREVQATVSFQVDTSSEKFADCSTRGHSESHGSGTLTGSAQQSEQGRCQLSRDGSICDARTHEGHANRSAARSAGVSDRGEWHRSCDGSVIGTHALGKQASMTAHGGPDAESVRLTPHVHFEALQGDHADWGRSTTDQAAPPWARMASFKSTCSFREGREVSMSFIVSPPHGQSANDETDNVARLLGVGTHAQQDRRAIDAWRCCDEDAAEDGEAACASSVFARANTTDSFSVTLPGQPAYAMVAGAFADAEEDDDSAGEPESTPPASAAIAAAVMHEQAEYAASHSYRSHTPSSEDSLDHYSGSSLSPQRSISARSTSARSASTRSPSTRSVSVRRSQAWRSPAQQAPRDPRRPRSSPRNCGQAVGEKANVAPGQSATRGHGCVLSPHRSPTARTAESAAAEVHRSNERQAGQCDGVCQQHGSMHSSPSVPVTGGLSGMHAEAGSGDFPPDAAACMHDGTTAGADGAAGTVDRTLDQHADSVQPARSPRSQHTAATGTFRTKKRRMVKTRAEVPPALPFVGSPTPSERHIPSSRRSDTLSRTCSAARSMTPSSPSRSPSNAHRSPTSSYAHTFRVAQATKKHLAASARMGADEPHSAAPAHESTGRMQRGRSAARSRSRHGGSPSRRRARPSASGAASSCPSCGCDGHGTAGEPRRSHAEARYSSEHAWCGCAAAAVAHLRPREPQAGSSGWGDGAARTGCWGGRGHTAQGRVSAGDTAQGQSRGCSPERDRNGGGVGPLQRSVSEWQSVSEHCDKCSSERASADAALERPEEAPARGNAAVDMGPWPAAPARAAQRTAARPAQHRGGCGQQRLGMCMGLETMHASTIGRPQAVASSRRAPAAASCCHFQGAGENDTEVDIDERRLHLGKSMERPHRGGPHALRAGDKQKTPGAAHEGNSGSMDSLTIPCGQHTQHDISSVTFTDVVEEDVGTAVAQPAAAQHRRWGRLLNCVGFGGRARDHED